MSYRLLGAVLVIAGCGGFGFSLVLEQKHRERFLAGLMTAVTYMQWELQYRLTPLPELCRKAGKQTGGEVGEVLKAFSRELDRQKLPDPYSCMQKILEEKEFPRTARLLLKQLGKSLGNFDLSGQLEGLKSVEAGCQRQAEEMQEGKQQRYKSYETLGLCTGAALVILFL